MKLHLHWYKEQFRAVAWSYCECRCGKRKIIKLADRGIGHQPRWEEWEKKGKIKPQYRSKKDRQKIVKIEIGERV